MRWSRLIEAVGLTFLVMFSAAPRGTVAQASPWFPKAQAYDYANNLIADFTNIVMFDQSHFSNFTTYQANFQLWHTTGFNFAVQVMRLSANLSDAVGFTFQPIQGNTPQISVVNNQTIDGLFVLGKSTQGGQTYQISPCTAFYTPYGNACVYYGVNTPTHSFYYQIIWVTGIECVLNDSSGENVEEAANGIYQQDLAFSIPQGMTVGNRAAEQTTELPISSLAPCMLAAGTIPIVFGSTSFLQEAWSWINNSVNFLASCIVLVCATVLVVAATRRKTLRRDALKWLHGG